MSARSRSTAMSLRIARSALGCLACIAWLGEAAAGEKPESLRRAEESRSSGVLNTTRFEYWTERQPTDLSIPRRQFYSSRSAGDDLLLVDHGAEDGVVARGEDGGAAPITYNGVTRSLLRGGQVWRHADRAPYAEVRPPDAVQYFHMIDLRRLGLNPVHDHGDFEAIARRNGEEVVYEETREGDQFVVTAKVSRGHVR